MIFVVRWTKNDRSWRIGYFFFSPLLIGGRSVFLVSTRETLKKRSSRWMQRAANKAWWRRARAKRLFDSCGLPQNWELTNLDEPADTRRVAQSRPWHRLNPRAMPLTHARTRQRMRPRSVKRSSWLTRKVDRQFIRTSVPDEFPWHVAFLIACLTV